ncbi:NAD-P-binding protein [Trametopsis cervina]|nr:NAD-P-binding protein [Trametopsis cervina]
MPALTSGKVLATGANGYIAVWTIKKLLEAGFSVRGAVRSEKSFPYLKNLFKEHGDKFELVIVPDITADGAYDEAVKGVQGIVHMASPFHQSAVEPSELIDPAVKGTTSILASLLKYGTEVKRFILLSSISCNIELWYPEPAPVNTEENWNTGAVVAVNEKGKDASANEKYFASKILAEKALWDFAAEHKGKVNFDVVSLNPALVIGPFLHDVATPQNLNFSIGAWFLYLVAGQAPKSELNTGFLNVDVRDVSDAFVRALQVPEAGGERITIHESSFIWQEYLNIAREIDPSLPAGDTDFDLSKAVYNLKFDNAKSRKLLGLTYIDKKTTAKDLLAQFKERGFY